MSLDHEKQIPLVGIGVSRARPGQVPLTVWLALALMTGILVLASQIRAVGNDPADLLAVGDSPLSQVVSKQFPGVAWDPAFKHDGHRYYAMALDLSGHSVPQLIGDPVYWYQRIAFPLIASAFGLLSGRLLLWSMIVWTLAGYVWSVGAVYLWTKDLRLHWLSPAFALANLGTLLGLSLLTADPIAIALFFTGVWLWNRERDRSAGLWMALAILTKEVFAVAVLAVAAFNFIKRKRSTAIPYLVSILPAAAWRIILMFRFGLGNGDGGGLGLPGAGLWSAFPVWPSNNPRDVLFLAATILAIVVGVWTVTQRTTIWPWLALPWVAVGLVGTHWVWDYGNNASRVLSPLLTISALALLYRFDRSRREFPPTPASP